MAMTRRHAAGVPTDETMKRQRRAGERIRSARKGLGLTSKQLAARASARLQREGGGDRLSSGETISQSMVSYYEHGRSMPSPAKQRALEAELGLPFGVLAVDLGLTPSSEESTGEPTMWDLVDSLRATAELLAARVAANEKRSRPRRALGAGPAARSDGTGGR